MATAAAVSASAASGNPSAFVELFGEKLVKEMGDAGKDDKTVSTIKALAGKAQVGVYFSAHWCPPCRGFTPELAKTYSAMKAAGKPFEIVFVSSDKDRKTCMEYHGEMPWLALPYDDRSLEKKLNKRYKIQGIPSLIILDGSGNLVSQNGRSFVTNDKTGEAFPWKPPTFKSALGGELLDGKKKVDVSRLEGKNIALYFSAHWCPPCRGFTPKLVKTYNAMKKTGKDFEFVFVSSDRDQAAFNEYYGEMPWLALPYSNRKGKEELSTMFGVRGIPSLVTLSNGGSDVINGSARGLAGNDPEGKDFPWYPKAVNDVNEVTDGLNEEVCVIVLLDGASADDQTKRKEDLEAVGGKYYAEARANKTESKYRFFFETKKSSVSLQIRKLCAVEDGAKTIVLNLGDEGSFYYAKDEGDVKALIAQFEGGKLEQKKIKR